MPNSTSLADRILCILCRIHPSEETAIYRIVGGAGRNAVPETPYEVCAQFSGNVWVCLRHDQYQRTRPTFSPLPRNVFLVRRGLFFATRVGGSSERMLQPKLYRLEHFCKHSTIPKPQVCFSVPAGNGRSAPQRLGAVICSFAALWDAVLVFLLALLSLLCCPKRETRSVVFFVSVTTPFRQARSIQ